jgi:hypothetical protein
LSARLVRLPFYHDFTAQEQSRVISELVSFVKEPSQMVAGR